MTTPRSGSRRIPFEESAQPRAADGENALRLFPNAPSHWKDNRITSGVFFERGDRRPSVFLKERLPNEDGSALHVSRLRSHGRARIRVGLLRAAKRGDEPMKLDLLMTGTAEPPLEAFGVAHGELTGTINKKAAQLLAALVMKEGEIEQAPR